MQTNAKQRPDSKLVSCPLHETAVTQPLHSRTGFLGIHYAVVGTVARAAAEQIKPDRSGEAE